jgi:hypothetical protein
VNRRSCLLGNYGGLLVDYLCLNMRQFLCIVHHYIQTLEGKAKFGQLDVPHGGISRNFWGRMFPYAAVMQTSGFTSFKSDRNDSCIASEITMNPNPP